MMSAESVNSQDVLDVLRTGFGHSQFRPGQREIVEAAVSGRDTVAVLPTGAGKSLCYQMTALLRPGVTMVVSPLVALMDEQVQTLNGRGIPAASLSGGLTRSESREVAMRVRAGDIKVLYLAPESIAEHKQTFLPWLSRRSIGLVAVDEAHCITEWGYDFRHDYRTLGELRDWVDAPFMAVTATATAECRVDVESQLQMDDPTIYVGSFARPNLRYQVANPRDRDDAVIDAVRNMPEDGTGIIYSTYRDEAERIAEMLVSRGVDASVYHAGLPRDLRRRRQQDFYDGRTQVMVATVAFGMGIDKSDVRLVLHYRTPSSVERYYQEAGRAGRDGMPSNCVMLSGLDDEDRLHYHLDQMPAQTSVEKFQRQAAGGRVDAILSYTKGDACRQTELSNYFGEAQLPACGTCDVCTGRRRGRPSGNVLFGALLRMRDGLVERRGYSTRAAVLTDSALRAISLQLPKNVASLSRIRGVGSTKANRYSVPILRLVKEFEQTKEGKRARGRSRHRR